MCLSAPSYVCIGYGMVYNIKWFLKRLKIITGFGSLRSLYFNSKQFQSKTFATEKGRSI